MVEGPCEVIAGPGSGKTSVIVKRLESLISISNIDPSFILTITFTKAAAFEMRSRAGNLLGDLAGALNIGTFHSIFLKILRHTYNFTKDNIISSHIQNEIIKEILESEKIELRDLQRSVYGIVNEISRVKSGTDRDGDFTSSVLSEEQFDMLLKRYRKRLSEMRLIDFDDIMLLSRELFLDRPNVLERWQNKFRFIMTDEFQDVDPLQYELLKLLSGENKNLFVVGDDDQSIYGFRGASPGIMREFIKDFPNAKLIYLSDNYRSVPEIVKGAGEVISENRDRLDKTIVSMSDDRGILEVIGFKDRESEVEAFRNSIDALNGEYDKAAILLRTNELVSYYTEKVSALDIPFRCREKVKNIYDHFIARDILDYLSLSRGNQMRSTFYRVMNHPYRGISRNALYSEKISYDEILRFHSEDIRTLSAIKRLKYDLGVISKMKPYAGIHYIYKAMGYERYLKDLSLSKGIDLQELMKTADEIKERAKGYRSFEAWENDIEDYSREIALLHSGEKGEKNPEKQGVSIMTLHASKGLEFEEVFLFDVNEKIIPYQRALLPAEIEEERRLLYVGMTRAKKKLHIWYIRDNMGKHMEPSRFIKGLLEIGEGFACSDSRI